MNNIVVALGIGLVAGIIDTVPMIIQKMDKPACLSAFVHWVVLGMIIPFVNWDIQPWLKGLVIGELMAIPVMIMVFPQDNKAVIPICLFSAVLGAGVGLAGSAFISS